jgi:hypothetical protein
VKCLVYIVEDWDVVKEYACHKDGFYQVISSGDGEEICLKSGQIGFVKQFDNKNDPLLEKIKKFCLDGRYIKVNGNIWSEFFFR